MLRSRKRPGISPLSTQPCPDESSSTSDTSRGHHGAKSGRGYGWRKRIVNIAIIVVASCIGIGAALMTLLARDADSDELLCSIIGVGCGDKLTFSSASSQQIDKSGLRRASSSEVSSTSTHILPSRHVQYVLNTPEYRRQCSWTYTTEVQRQCTFLVRPNPKSGEGMADWISNVVAGYIYSVQAGCKLTIDYGPSVEVDKVWSPPSGLSAERSWVIAPGSECKEKDHCMGVFNMGSEIITRFVQKVTGSRTKAIATVPYYRMAYSRSDNVTDEIKLLKKALPGFEYETGFACAMHMLFDLPQSAADYLPTLLTHILPTVRDPVSLVITVYVRTGRTDDAARLEKDGKANIYHNHTYVDTDLMNCALSTERQRFEDADGLYDNIVWLVITDSAKVSEVIISQYNGKQENVINGKKIHRKVISTSSQGIQSRPERDPSTADFADAAMDWWLIGEADVLVTHGATSFGTTAAMRTAIPLYTAIKGECTLRHFDNDGSAVIPGFVQMSVKPGEKIDLLGALKAQGFTINGKPAVGGKRIK